MKFCESPEWDIQIEHKKRGITFWFDFPDGNEEEKLKRMSEIKKEVSISYAGKIEDTTRNRIDSIYLSLKKEGREKLIKSEKDLLKNS